MSLHTAYSEPSDEERLNTPSERHPSIDRSSRRRSTRACDQCRRTKSKCERDKSASAKQPCRGCVALGLSCTYAGPSHKRGPPKGYILAIERRLHQVEALLGTIIGSDDPRARGILQDLSQDQLASQIIQRVDVGPFGPKGRVAHPFGSTKEDFLASIMTGIGEETAKSSKGNQTFSPRSDHLALVSPSSSWQDNLQRLLLPRASGMAFPQNDSEAAHPGITSPDPRARRASFPLMSNNVTFPTKVLPISPMTSLSSLASLSSESGIDRMGWDTLEGLEKIDSDSAGSEDLEVRLPPKVEDIYIDEDAQLRVSSRISGLQILHQCEKILTGRRGEQLECPWPAQDSRIGRAFTSSPLLSQMPTEQRQHALIQSYFEYVHPMFPVINRSLFATLYNQKLNNLVQGVLRSSELARTAFDVLLFSIFANSSRSLDHHTGEHDSNVYVSESVRLLLSVNGQSHPLLCQALLLLGYHNIGVGVVEAAWTYIGVAVRMAESLGIHRAVDELSSSGSPMLSKEEQQMRQQVWAGCLIADRYIAALLGRPSAVRQVHFDVPPVDVSQSSDEESMFYHVQHESGVRAQQVSEMTALLCLNASSSLSSIVGSIMTDLYPITQPSRLMLEHRAKQLEYRLFQWRQSLPTALLFDPSRISALPPPCVLELQVQYWWTVILLHRAFVHGPLTKGFYAGPESMQSKALGVCRDAAGQISAIVAIMQNQPPRFTSAFVPGYLLAVGVVDILTLSILHHDESASSRLRSTMTALQRVENIWPMARVIQNLLDKTTSTSGSTPVAVPPSPRTSRPKRTAGEVFSDDEHADVGMKKMSDQPSPAHHYIKDPGSEYDSLGRMLGLDTGLGFITTQPYPGFQYRSPHLDNQPSVHSFTGVGYSPESFSTVAPPATSFGLW